jgi:hypothetical protein
VDCKIVFIGDPAQLTPVKSTATPVFDQAFTKVKLTQVVRQAEGSPITALATQFRETVNTGQFFKFKPDQASVIYLDRDDFNTAIDQEFTRQHWHYSDSKILAWTNKAVINYNKYVSNMVSNDPELSVGDYAVVNSFISAPNRSSFKTDESVMVTGIGPTKVEHGITGRCYELNYMTSYFMPDSFKEKQQLLKELRAKDNIATVTKIETEWIDLRAAYACTVNKSQGSTYDMVFIDLDDISRCNSGNQIARMLYVAVSRARNRVYLTGDLV